MIAMMRTSLLVLGTFLLFIGILALFIPIVPTVPFLLVSGLCYLKSSKRFYNWLTNNRFLGHHFNKYIKKSPDSDEKILCVSWSRMILFYSIVITGSSAVTIFAWLYFLG